MIGTTVFHYKILEKLGEGGMGVVYKAHDTELDRDVALKFLPHHITVNEAEQARFLQEARAAAVLNNPNICTVYAIEKAGDQQFIAMEYVEGKTLRQLIPIQKTQIAIDYAIQIGEALQEAHSKGIVHRDIKADNIMVNAKNQIKVMDFGLAKLKGSLKLTRTSSTVGTLAYMAPEQIQGGEVDARSDIFSFGVVLYEMLTGHLPFRGEHEAAMVYSIVNEPALPIEKYLPDVSSELLHILNRALEKDPEDRYQSVHDMVIDLRRLRKETSRVTRMAPASESFEGSTGIDQRSTTVVRFWTKKRTAIVSIAALLVCVVATLFFLNQSKNLPQLNPDGKATIIPATRIARYCALSYDGNWIAFGAYDDNGNWDIYYMNSTGGAIRRVTQDATGEAIPGGCSRDGAWILYSRQVGGRYQIALVPTLGGPVRTIANGYCPRFSPMGDKVYYVRGGPNMEPSESGKYEVCSVDLDGRNKRVVFVDPGFASEGGNITHSMSVSPDGKSIAWIKAFRDFTQDIITYNLEKKVESRVTHSQTLKDEVFWTHDNHLIYSSFANGNFDLWICSANGGDQLQLTRSRNDELYGALSSDGSKLLYYEQNISGNIKSMDLTTGKVTSWTSDDHVRFSLCVSPDMRYAGYFTGSSYTTWRTLLGIEIIDTRGENAPRSIVADERNTGNKAWSPDGQWIAFAKPPDTVGGTIKICIVSPFDGKPSKVVAEAKGTPQQNRSFRWVGRDSLSWFSDMKTWVSAIEKPKPIQVYEDSTLATMIQDGKYVFYRDFRSGRQGWWIDRLRMSAAGKGQERRRLLDPVSIALAPSGTFCLHETKPGGEILRVSLPDGKTTRLPFRLPIAKTSVSITQDGKALVYIEHASNSKLMLWQNPFIKE